MEGLVPEKEETDFIYIFQRVVGNLSDIQNLGISRLKG